MKKILYFFIAAFIISSTQSCKRLSGDDGDLLNNLGANLGGVGGARFLYQEVNSVDTLAQYNYNGTKMVEVLSDSAITKITYNGELINRINYDGVVEGDSTSYTRYFTYDATAKYIINISETRSLYKDVRAVLPLLPAPVEKYKSLFDITYSTDKKLATILSRTGKETVGNVFAFTSYTRSTFTYDTAKKNVTKVIREAGPLAGTVFGPAAQTLTFAFSEYDDKISPYTLLPFGYKLNKMIDTPAAYYWDSMNNPKRTSVPSDVGPFPIEYSTQFTYDAQDYATSGYGINYDYRPF